MKGPVLTVKGAADYCGLSVQTLYNLKHEQRGPVAYKQGRLTVYYPADLDEWLAKTLVPSAPSSATPSPTSVCRTRKA